MKVNEAKRKLETKKVKNYLDSEITKYEEEGGTDLNVSLICHFLKDYLDCNIVDCDTEDKRELIDSKDILNHIRKTINARPELREYDYNIFRLLYVFDHHVSGTEYLYEYISQVENAYSTIVKYVPFRRGVCKDCGEEFSMCYSQVNFFKDRGLKVPHRCEYCRKKRKGEQK